MARLLVPIVLLVIVVAASLVTDRPQPPADFTFINQGDVNTLDLQRMSWMQDLRVARLLFEGLVRNDVLTWGYDITPGVAERWDISEDGRTYTFHLRESAKWSNGQPVTAHDFVYAWRRAILPDTGSDYIKLFHLVEGSSEFTDWRQAQLDEYAARPESEKSPEAARDLLAEAHRRFGQTVGIRALDDRTFRVTLTEATPYFLDLCAFPVFYPVYPPLLRQYEAPSARTGMIILESGWTKPGVLVSNGPFELTLWRFKRDMRFEVNQHFWDKQSLAIRSIKIPSVEDPNTMVLAFESGAAQWVTDVTADYRADILDQKLDFYQENREQYEALKAQGYDQFEIDRRLPDDPRKNVHAVPAFGTYWYNFNCLPQLLDGRDNPFADPRVRRAFAMAIDKESIVKDIRRTGEPVARTIIPPGSIAGYDSPKGLKCISDGRTPAEREAIAAEARALLAQAGYPNPSEDFPVTVELLFNKAAGHDLIAQAIAKNWERYLGVQTLLKQREIKVFRDDLKKQRYMTGRAGWYGDYGDPTTFLDVNRKDDGNNDRKYSSPVYESLLDQAKDERDPQKRLDLLSEAERLIMEEDLPMVPLYHYVTMYMFDPDEVTGLNPHPRTMQNVFLVDVLGDGVGPDEPRPMPLRPVVEGEAP